MVQLDLSHEKQFCSQAMQLIQLILWLSKLRVSIWVLLTACLCKWILTLLQRSKQASSATRAEAHDLLCEVCPNGRDVGSTLRYGLDLARARLHFSSSSPCRSLVLQALCLVCPDETDASQTQQKEHTQHLARHRYSEGPVMVILAATKLFIALICATAYSEAADQEAGPLVQVNFYGRLDLLT